jgi:hypothetical protein
LGQLAQSHLPVRGQSRRLPAGKDDGPARVRPRDLRSSFATLLIYEGQPPQYVADQLGNSPGTLLRDYARVWEDFDPSQRVSAETQIERVRARLRRAAPTRTSAPQQRPRRAGRRQRVSQVFHDASPTPLAITNALEIPEALCRTRTDDPFLTMEVLYQLS